jgi:hypothetical protein
MEACLQEIVDVTITFFSLLGRGSGEVRWSTTHEVSLIGFNIVEFDARGNRQQLNYVAIPCTACITGEGGTYSFLIPKHRSGRNIFIEGLCREGDCLGPWGPAVRE